VSIFSILNRPCSFMACYYLFGVFLSMVTIISSANEVMKDHIFEALVSSYSPGTTKSLKLYWMRAAESVKLHTCSKTTLSYLKKTSSSKPTPLISQWTLQSATVLSSYLGKVTPICHVLWKLPYVGLKEYVSFILRCSVLPQLSTTKQWNCIGFYKIMNSY